jgi:hypothetical protein
MTTTVDGALSSSARARRRSISDTTVCVGTGAVVTRAF